MTPRDIELVDLLHRHRVFTTDQLARIAFDNVRTARNRLGRLATRGVLASFRGYQRPGSQQNRWTLGPVGLAYLAHRDERPAPRPRTIAERIDRLASNPHLAHLLGVNGFFVDLIAHSRAHPGTGLDYWWSERQCREYYGELVRPDGAGQWIENFETEHERKVSFWLEYDRATEPTHRVAEKVGGYADMRRVSGLDQPLLFRMQTARQETELQKRLARHPAISGGHLVVATTSGNDPLGPAGPVWLPVGHGSRVRLIDLGND